MSTDGMNPMIDEEYEEFATAKAEAADAMMEHSFGEYEEWIFNEAFERGYMAGIDRGMEVEHELERDTRLEHDLFPGA